MMLNRVEQNDPTLTLLNVLVPHYNDPRFVIRGARRGDCYYPSSGTDLARLGKAIGANTALRALCILDIESLVEMTSNDGAFFEGLNRNTSIQCLDLSCWGPNNRNIEHVVNMLVAKRSSLTSISLSNHRGGVNGAIGAVTRCTNLDTIHLTGSINADVEFVSGIAGLGRLKNLSFPFNNFGVAGCEALATLLRDPNCNLECLDLGLDLGFNRRIDDDCVRILAHSLKRNCKLRALGLHGIPAITEIGWDAFSLTLCNTSSVMDTYRSNHTLHDIGFETALPTHVSSLLEINCDRDKRKVAIRKILRHHDHLDLKPFIDEWELKMLPFIISWLDGARGVTRNNKASIDAKKLSSIYEFTQALPLSFVPRPRIAGAKRKNERRGQWKSTA